MKIFILLIAMTYAAINIKSVPNKEWIPVIPNTTACDTLESFKESDSSGYYVLKCDTTLIRCIYESNGHYDVAYKRLNNKTYLELCFKKYNKQSYIDSFNVEGDLVYHKDYIEGIYDTIIYGKKYR